IDDRQRTEGWGSAFIPRLARELHNELPELKGFSERNIGRMIAFYREYPNPGEILPQPAAKLETPRGSPPNSPRRGRNTSARGNAPGTEKVVNPDRCPERAKQVRRRPESCVAPSGLGVEEFLVVPGHCPGLMCCGPFGAEIPSSPGPNRVVFGKKSAKLP